MAKSVKQKNSPKQSKSFYSTHPWECRYYQDHSEILAYVEASGKWETILNVRQTSGISDEAMAVYVAQLINDNQPARNLLRDAMAALELVMNDGLTFSSEQAADSVINRMRKIDL